MRPPAALVSIESQPKWAHIRIGRRTAFATILMHSILGSTALDLLHRYLSHSIDSIYLSILLWFYCYQKKNFQAHTPLQGILPVQSLKLTISHQDPEISARPWTATVISMRSSLKICSLKKRGMYHLTCVSQSGMVYKAREENLGKVLRRFLFHRRACEIIAMCTPLL